MPAVNSSAKVLITGVNGYLGAWTVRKFLDEGFHVRGSVRSVDRSSPHLIGSLFAKESAQGRFELVEVADITKPGAFDDAVKGIDVIVHTASPFALNLTDPEDVIKPAVDGTLSILRSTKAHGAPTVKRFIYLSSIVAAFENALTLDEGNWNNPSVEAVEKYQKSKKEEDLPDPWVVYCASKTLAERAAWAFVRDADVKWDLVVLNPPFIYGPAIHFPSSPPPTAASLNESLAKLHGIVVTGERSVSADDFEPVIDVRDTARLLVLAALHSSAGGERFLVGVGEMFDQTIIDIANGLKPPPLGVGASLAKNAEPGATRDKKKPYTVDVGKAERAFGAEFKYTPFEETVRDTLVYFKDNGLDH